MQHKKQTYTNDGGSNKTYSGHFNTQVASQAQPGKFYYPRSNDWTTWVKNAQPHPVNVGDYVSPYKEIYYHSPVAHNKPQGQTADSTMTRPVSRKRNVVGNYAKALRRTDGQRNR